MYSVLLAAALFAGGETTTWHGCRGCHGCWGGQYPGYRAGCWGCHGCSGGGCFGGGCFGGGCFGGSGWAYYASGCHGGWGGCYGSYSGCHGCFGGSSVVVAVPAFSVGHGCHGSVVAAAPARLETDRSLTPRNEQEREAVRRTLDRMRDGGAPPPPRDFVPPPPRKKGDQARLTVHVPEDARLYVDNVPVPLTSAVRSFDTPELQPGQSYYYTLRAEVEREGRTVTDSQRVYVSAGDQVSVNLAPSLTAQR